VARHEASFPSPLSVVEANPFQHNLNVNIPEHDELLEKALWRDVRSAESGAPKRGDKVIKYNLRGKLNKRAVCDLPIIQNISLRFSARYSRRARMDR
jgi:hypothetical protein